jgi:heme exporter protein B
MKGFSALVSHDLKLALRQGSAATLAVSFFIIMVTLFPLGVGPEVKLLARIGPGVLWAAALLSAVLSLDRLFQADYDDGSLDLVALAPMPLELAVLGKTLSHWLTAGLPLVVISPVLSLLLEMPTRGIPVLLIAMGLGTAVMSLIGAIGAALTVSVRRGGVLLSLLVLPLYIPVLIFGVATVSAAEAGTPVLSYLLVLLAFFVAALGFAPLAAAAGLRAALD